MNRGAALTLSLLVAMGLVPAACSSSAVTGETPPDGAAGQGGEGNGGSALKPSAGEAGADVKGDGGAAPYRVGTCTNPQVDPLSGLVKCDEGFSHRAAAKRCEPPAMGSGGEGGAGGMAGSAGAGGAMTDVSNPQQLPRVTAYTVCESDPSVCGEFQYGFCRHRVPEQPHCVSGCVTDADCGSGAVCVCGDTDSPSGGECVTADCTTDDDCGAGLCASYQVVCGDTGFTCQSRQDACISTEDCPSGVCTYDPVSGDLPASVHRYCDDSTCGRPFLVHDQARVAPVTRSAAWRASEQLKPRIEHLTDAERASLAAHWAKLGQLEHASIAAFARFSLQLLALGAPPELVESCTQALADETAHTKLCFELASAYAGRAVGPGPLDIAGSLAASSLADIVDLVLAEGCFGETSAALEAFEAAESAVEPVIAAVYSQIASDEQRHAELAFRFVRWALERGGEAVTERIQAAMTMPPAANARAHSVTLPCLQALLQAFGTAPQATQQSSSHVC